MLCSALTPDSESVQSYVNVACNHIIVTAFAGNVSKGLYSSVQLIIRLFEQEGRLVNC